MRTAGVMLLLVLATGCHAVLPLSGPNAPDGRTDTVTTPDAPASDAPVPADLGPDHRGPQDAVVATDAVVTPPPDQLPAADQAGCVPATLFTWSAPLSQPGWTLEGACDNDGSDNLLWGNNLEGAAYLAKLLSIPAGCGVTVTVSGSFSKGELWVELHETQCNSAAGCQSTNPSPPKCLLPDTKMTSTVSCTPTAADAAARVFQTLRLYRPPMPTGGPMTGSAKVSFIKVTVQ